MYNVYITLNRNKYISIAYLYSYVPTWNLATKTVQKCWVLYKFIRPS